MAKRKLNLVTAAAIAKTNGWWAHTVNRAIARGDLSPIYEAEAGGAKTVKLFLRGTAEAWAKEYRASLKSKSSVTKQVNVRRVTTTKKSSKKKAIKRAKR